LMNTLPGLPMFAHGQIEGYTEKYGMEYQRAYYDENPIDWLIERHEREVFPVLKKRYIFSEVKNFWIYDFLYENGNVDENVFVYSNQHENEKGLVLFNNKYESASGAFYFAREKLVGNSSKSSSLYNTNIAENLNIKNSDFHFYILRDATSGLEYFFNGKELHENGIFINLAGYEYRVYLNFEEVFDPSGEAYLYYKTNFGRGNYNVKRELGKIRLSSLHNAFDDIFSDSFLKQFFDLTLSRKPSKQKISFLEEEAKRKLNVLIDEMSEQILVKKDISKVKDKFLMNFTRPIKMLHIVKGSLNKNKIKVDKEILDNINNYTNSKLLVLLIFNAISILKEFIDDKNLAKNYLRELMLTKPIKKIISKNAENEEKIGPQILLINILLQLEEEYQDLDKLPDEYLKLRSPKKIYELLVDSKKEFMSELMKKELITTFLNVNLYNEKEYFNKESWEEVLDQIHVFSIYKYYNAIQLSTKTKSKQKIEFIRFVKKSYSINNYLKKQAISSKYLFKDLLVKIKLN